VLGLKPSAETERLHQDIAARNPAPKAST